MSDKIKQTVYVHLDRNYVGSRLENQAYFTSCDMTGAIHGNGLYLIDTIEVEYSLANKESAIKA